MKILKKKNIEKKNRHVGGRLKQRIVSVTVALVLVLNSVPMEGLVGSLGFPNLFGISAPITASAYSPAKAAEFFEGTSFSFDADTLSDFIDYCYHYSTSDDFAGTHKGDSLSFSGVVNLSADFVGLGNATYPFEGSVRFPTNNSYNVTTHRAFFSYVSDKATITSLDGSTNITLNIIRSSGVGDDESKPIFADHVVGGSGSASWSTLIGWPDGYSGDKTFSGIFGDITQNAKVTVSFTKDNDSTVVFNGSTDLTDAGIICGSIEDGSRLTVTSFIGAFTNVTSASGNAGGLVGFMGDEATLTYTAPAACTASVTAKGGFAGGLVGVMAPSATISSRPTSISGSIKGTDGAGGIYGKYGFTGDQILDLTDGAFETSATVSGGSCGGLFGELDCGGNLTITSRGTSKSFSTNNSGGGCFGGVIGKLISTSGIRSTVSIEDLNLSTTANTTLSAYGGVIGTVDSAAYVKVDNVMVNATDPDSTDSFGGVIGTTSEDDGVFVDLGNFTLTANNFVGGGIVGTFNNGVLRLSGTTNMTAAKPSNADGCGQLVGKNDNVLVYALGTGSNPSPNAFTSGWKFLRSDAPEADDLGTWGEVVRISNVETDILTFNDTAHTVTVKAAETAIDTPAKFVKTALNIQLNDGNGYDCLLFAFGSSAALCASGTTLTLGADISLANTGITGLMRDGGTDTTSFAGTFNGNSYKIKLAVGETYGIITKGETEKSAAELKSALEEGQDVTDLPDGLGQIYRHTRNGLFGILSGTVKDLTVEGDIDVRNCVDGMNIGSIAAQNGGGLTLNGVTTKNNIFYTESSLIDGSKEAGKNIGGLIGFVGADGTISINGVSSVENKLKLKGAHGSWGTYGGAIGKVTAETFNINIGTASDEDNILTVKLDTDISKLTSVGANSDCGGLIGHIISVGAYGSRIVNIDNLDFDGCTLGNAATANGGGLLGYAWLNTTANINGMTVTSATINDRLANGTAGGSANLGAMCYCATGKWDVGSLEVTSLEVNGGAATSVGMLVNKAYTDDTVSGKHVYTGGLYLDLLNSGYTLTSVTLPATPAKYDEIAAYTAKDEDDILTGGAGVVSIDMNTSDGTETRVAYYESSTLKGTGTYTNKLTSYSTTVNPTSRYYYNLCHMSKSNDGQNLLLWSVKNYAYKDIQGAFDTTFAPATVNGKTTTTLSGAADMTGLSFYPVALADDIVIGTLTLTSDYDSVFAKTGSTMDPAKEGTTYGQNQHYLMQSGLFLNSTAGKSTVINGTLTLNGNFLETANYQGVLISNTMRGSLTMGDDGAIVLNGIKPLQSGNAYTSGYLLINNIKRASEQVPIPELSLHDVSLGSGYTAGTAVAKSLIGPAIGSTLIMNFSKIKLPGDTASKIFSDSTLVESIRTNQKAQLKYNFTYNDDWGGDTPSRNVTYGYEITGSVQYADKEKKYSSLTGTGVTDPKRWYVRSDSKPESAPDTPSDFSTGYLRYVYQPYTNNTAGEDGFYYCELKVNFESDGLTSGCGTYNHPYLITSPEELQSVAKFLTDGDYKDLGTVRLPKTKAHLTSGDRWCTSKTDDAEYTYNTTAAKFKSATTGVTVEWSILEVQEYLAAAYYKIGDNLTLDSEQFVGLGGKTANTAFRGVIVGETNNDGTPKYTINNLSSNPFIKVSNGSVIKDVKITVGANVPLTQESLYDDTAKKYYTFGYGTADTADLQAVYYGGIIGEIMGGDNIIDNSYVDYGISTITLTGENGTTIPVGGYVGVIVYGGLIFKNMTPANTTIANTHLNVVYTGHSYNLASNSGDEAWAAIYVNPIVGRVINGYAVNETEDIYETAEEAAAAGHDEPEVKTPGRFTISEDGTYHDDENTVRLALPSTEVKAKVEAYLADKTQPAPTDEEMEQYNNLSKLHTLKNGTKHYTIADINKSETNKLNVTSVAAAGTDGTISVPNAQALFVLSLITQSGAGTATTAGGDYAGTISYGTDTTNVCGMSHMADYSFVGKDMEDDPDTTDIDESKLTPDDYTVFANGDTAANTAIPYIIRHYTVGSYDYTAIAEHIDSSAYTGTAASLNGKTFVITNKQNKNGWHTIYLIGEDAGSSIASQGGRQFVLKAGLDDSTLAEKLTFNKINVNGNDYYTISFVDGPGNDGIIGTDDDVIKYLQVTDADTSYSNKERGNLKLVDSNSIDSGCYFTASFENNYWYISGVTKDKNNKEHTQYIAGSKKTDWFFNSYEDKADSGALLQLWEFIPESRTYGYDYPARCVTSTAGYYDINLTAGVEYALPDSFRGLGCVGIRDSNGLADKSTAAILRTNQYSIKLDTFDGKGCTIDADIYLNKFKTDNYFNVVHDGASQTLSSDTATYLGNKKDNKTVNHGIGLFDSVITKDASSKISNFTLTGSVNTEVYGNTYASEDQEFVGVVEDNAENTTLWLCTAGVCGWSMNNQYIKFDKIAMNDLTVNGSNFVGGLLGFSGISSATVKVIVQECSADDISLKMSAASKVGSLEQTRNAMGCFVGKVQEGAVVIYGTEHDYSIANDVQDVNDDLTDYSEVKIKSFGFSDPTKQYYAAAGGLVGFAGHCCQAYDMKITSSNETVTIGNNLVRFSGGIAGGMQSFDNSTSGSNATSAIADFRNCTVEDLNIEGEIAGGIYGGKWNSLYTPYTITLDNCKMVGKTTNNHIAASKLNDNACAGGFIGRGLVKTSAEEGDSNILIKDCTVSNYEITAANEGNSAGYAGGFIGYCSSFADSSSITCYIHDSSVERSKIGASGEKSYGGGAIGWIAPKETTLENKMLGYNIKLDNVTSDSGDNMGAWVGYLNAGKTTIQFTGMAIYGEGFSNNIGGQPNSGVTLKESFVYADYSGMSYGVDSTAETVEGSAHFDITAKTRTITRTVVGAEKTQVFRYSYSADPVVTDIEAADSWSIDGNTVTHIQDSKQYVYTAALTDNEIYSIDADTKTIIRKVIPVGSGTVKELTYNYTAAPVVTTEATAAYYWSIDETNGKITHRDGTRQSVYTIAVSGLNKGDIVTMPKYPFVNINAQSKLGDNEVLSSDGAVLYKDEGEGVDLTVDGNNVFKDEKGNYYPSARTMAAMIYKDVQEDSLTRRYTTFGTTGIDAEIDTTTHTKLLDYMQRTTEDDGDRISTFQTERQVENLQDNVEDFAVIVIANGDDDETTNLINRYIQLVTNTSSTKNYAEDNDYYNVDIKTCKYVYSNGEGSFEIQPTTPALNIATKENNGERYFKIDQHNVDSKGQGTFTLIDVQFLDPFDTTKIAYHLYVPVYTEKEMAINFYAVAKTGAYPASSTVNSYAELMDDEYGNNGFRHADSLDTWMTQYIRYEYDPEDITALLNSGKLRWNYDKSLDFKTQTNAGDELRLPGTKDGDDTYMVLVDPNGNSDRAYYANVSDMISYNNGLSGESNKDCWQIDFSAFKDDRNNTFSFPSFNTIVESSIEAVRGNSYRWLDPDDSDDAAAIAAENYSVRIGTKYYVFTDKNDGEFDIKVMEDVDTIYEDYYISIKVPKPDNYNKELYHYSVDSPTRFYANTNSSIIRETGFSENVKSAGLTQPFKCTILIAELFEQTVTETVDNKTVSRMSVNPENEVITASERTINVDISTLIKLKNPNAYPYVNADEFFQSYYLTLVRTSENGTETDIQALTSGNINAVYSIDSKINTEVDKNDPSYNAGTNCADVTVDTVGNFINVQTFGAAQSSNVYSRLESGGQFVIYSRITMNFDEEKYTDEFPERSAGQDEYGVNVQAASNLAFDTTTLSHTSMTEKYSHDPHNYYIEDVKNASLRYVSKSNDLDLYDEIGLNSSNRSTLGVNGLSVDDSERTNIPEGSGYMPVNTEAFYYIQDVPKLEEAKGMKLTLTLKRKSVGGYVDCTDFNDYFTGDVSFTLGDTIVTGTIDAENSKLMTATFNVSGIDLTELDFVDVVITFNAKSGENFHQYANYRVDLTAELYKDVACTNYIENSMAPDYLIYTNAKINPELLSVLSAS